MSRAIFHLTSFMWAVVFSYFFFPKNLSETTKLMTKRLNTDSGEDFMDGIK